MEEVQEIPPDIKLAMSVSPVRQEYLAWRVVAYKSDGSYYFVPNNNGYDYKLKRNAENAARIYNNIRRGSVFAVVKRIKIVETEIE